VIIGKNINDPSFIKLGTDFLKKKNMSNLLWQDERFFQLKFGKV
jgi:hypothetical protein